MYNVLQVYRISCLPDIGDILTPCEIFNQMLLRFKLNLSLNCCSIIMAINFNVFKITKLKLLKRLLINGGQLNLAIN